MKDFWNSFWETQRWAWRPKTVSQRAYPPHGISAISNGDLKGCTSTDYFHWICPTCGEELYRELMGIRDDSNDRFPNTYTVVIGLACKKCGMLSPVKIGCLQEEWYQYTLSSEQRDAVLQSNGRKE